MERRHYIKNRDGICEVHRKGKDGTLKTFCGLNLIQNNKGLKYTNAIRFVDCTDCLDLYNEMLSKRPRQVLCSFCSTALSDEDYENPNDFFLSCHNHKYLAQMETEKHLKTFPVYNKIPCVE